MAGRMERGRSVFRSEKPLRHWRGGASFILAFCVFFSGCAKEEIKIIKEGTMREETKNLDIKEGKDKPIEESVIEAEGNARLNPFLSAEEEAAFADSGSNYILIDYPAPSAIIYSSDGNSKAIINGRILGLGNSIDDKEIIAIRPEEVILKDSQSEYILKLKKAGR